MKQIAIVIFVGEVGGVESALINMLRVLDYTKYRVTLYTNLQESFFPAELREKLSVFDVSMYSTKRLARYYLKDGKFFRCLRLCTRYLQSKGCGEYTEKIELLSNGFPISETKYDCAIAYKMNYETVATVLFQLSAKKKVFWVHGFLWGAPNLDKRYMDWIRAYDHIFGVSDDLVKQTCSMVSGIDKKMSTFLNIMDSETICRKTLLLHDEVGLEMKGNGEMKLLSVGRFSTEKNFAAIPYICSRLLKKGINVFWYLIGSGPEEENIQRNILSENVQEHVFILGKKENPYPYIAACDVYIQPSLHEGRSIAVVEAQILGKPVIITNYATAKSQLHDGVDGLIVPMEPGACAEAIANILKDKELLLKIAEGTKQFDYCNKDEIKKLYALIED